MASICARCVVSILALVVSILPAAVHAAEDAGSTGPEASVSGSNRIRSREARRKADARRSPRARKDPGARTGRKEKAEGDAEGAKDVDTEHLFGFSEGADAGKEGEREIVVDTVARIGKRLNGPGRGHYRVFDTRLGYQIDPIDRLSVELSAYGSFREVRNVLDLDDKTYGTFDGVALELKYQFLKSGKAQPLGLALEVRPRFSRVLPIEGNGADIFDIESLLQFDVQVVPDKLWYGGNISFEPAAGRQRGVGAPGYRSSTFLWSNALVARIGDSTYLGPEIRYLRGYAGTFLNDLESEALTVGPALHHRFTDEIWFTLAYAGQVWGRDADPALSGRALGLNQFERHAVRVKFGMEF